MIVIGEEPRDHVLLRPNVKYVGNMHGNEASDSFHSWPLFDTWTESFALILCILTSLIAPSDSKHIYICFRVQGHCFNTKVLCIILVYAEMKINPPTLSISAFIVDKWHRYFALILRWLSVVSLRWMFSLRINIIIKQV